MNNPVSKKPFSPIARDEKVSSFVQIPSLSTIASAIVIIFLLYAFFSGLLHQFYASFLFFFYSFTHRMWISVMLLGVFQTLLMIPFRIMRVIQSNNIQEFQHTVEKIESETQQTFILKKRFRQGNMTFLFYSVDFVMQIVSYVSLGRLFLTDFYSQKIDPSHLYDWVRYPTYPIQDTWFKLPYPYVTETLDLGWKVLLPTWIVLVIVQLVILLFKKASEQRKREEEAKQKELEEKVAAEQAELAAQQAAMMKQYPQGYPMMPMPVPLQAPAHTDEHSPKVAPEEPETPHPLTRYTTGYLLLFMLIAWYIVHHFPIGWDLKIFTGDVSLPNRTFNTVTAIATFITMLWHAIPKIVTKGHLAEKMGIPNEIIEKTQKEMFKDSLFTSALVGLGAFYITNQIPSAFELSIFTLEVISLLSPFTLDKVVLGSLAVKKDEITEAEVAQQFKHK